MATGRIGVTPTLGTRWSKAPSAGTTSLSGLDDNSVSLVYSVGYEAVYRNGVLLSRTNDYTATDGTTVTLIDATIAGDIIEIFANQLVPLSDAISKGQFTAKAALLSATAASTPAVLTVGANDTVLTADSSTATGLKWATVAAGGMTELASGSLSGSTVTLSSINQTYKNLQLVLANVSTSATSTLQFRVNGSGAGYVFQGSRIIGSTTSTFGSAGESYVDLAVNLGAAYTDNQFIVNFTNYAASAVPIGTFHTFHNTSVDSEIVSSGSFTQGDNKTAISSININLTTGTFDGGTYILYGVK